MKDIAKCAGTNCGRRDTCIRFTQPERTKFQSWLFMRVSIPDTDKCRFYMPAVAKEEV